MVTKLHLTNGKRWPENNLEIWKKNLIDCAFLSMVLQHVCAFVVALSPYTISVSVGIKLQ